MPKSMEQTLQTSFTTFCYRLVPTTVLSAATLLDENINSSSLPMVRLELATPGLQTQCSSHWAIQLRAIAGKELSLSSWCIASLYIYHFSTVIDFSSEKYSGSTGHTKLLVPVEKFVIGLVIQELRVRVSPSASSL